MTSSGAASDPPTVDPRFAAEAERLGAGCVDVLPTGELAALLQRADREERPLRVKLGLDPTSPDVHLGHAVVLAKLREFQDAGHLVVLIIGDYTARVGDPTGRSKARPHVDGAQIDANARTYREQAFRILDADRTEVRSNGEWLGALTPLEIFGLLRHATAAQVLDRDDFATRLRDGVPIGLIELIYPLLQGYDSVAIRADVEFGGVDQLLNLLMGRHLMPLYGQRPQAVMTTPLLRGIDGAAKMSKSLGNHIGLLDAPEDAYGRVMSIPDELMPEWYGYAAGLSWDVAQEYVAGLASGTTHPGHAKRTLARHIVERLHGTEAAAAAARHFDTVFRDRAIPDEMPEVAAGEIARNEAGRIFLPGLLSTHMGAASNGEARRLIASGGVRIGGEVVKEGTLEVEAAELVGRVVQVGRRRFLRIR